MKAIPFVVFCLALLGGAADAKPPSERANILGVRPLARAEAGGSATFTFDVFVTQANLSDKGTTCILYVELTDGAKQKYLATGECTLGEYPLGRTFGVIYRFSVFHEKGAGLKMTAYATTVRLGGSAAPLDQKTEKVKSLESMKISMLSHTQLEFQSSAHVQGR
jgi:hypothetical protein